MNANLSRGMSAAVLLLLGMFSAPQAEAQNADLKDRIATGIELIKLGCGTVQSGDKAAVAASASGSITLRALPSAKAGAEVVYSKEEIRGLASALKSEIDNNTLHLSEKQLDCMRPYIDTIFLELFPKPPAGKGPTGALTMEDATLASVNNILEKKIGFRLGAKFDSGGRVVKSRHLSSSFITGDFNYLRYSSQDNKETTITVYSDTNWVIKALSVENWADAKRRALKDLYIEMLRSWNDKDPVNLISNTTNDPNPYGPYRTVTETDGTRITGSVKYTYLYSNELDRARDLEPEFERIFFALKN